MKRENIYNNKGITLIILIVTIIVLMIIAGTATFSGINSIQESRENTQLAELGMVQQAVLENYTKYKMTKDAEYLIGKQIVNYTYVSEIADEINKYTKDKITLKIKKYHYNGIGDNTYDESYYYYELQQEDLEKLGIKQEKDIYIVNYVSGEVINKNLLVTGTGKPLYTYAVEEP